MNKFLTALLLILSINVHAETPLYGQVIVDSGSIQNGDTLVVMGMSNWKQINDHFNVPGINHINTACGGCVVGTWARGAQTFKGRALWSGIPNNTNIVWINPVNIAVTDLNTYVVNTTADTERLLLLIADRLPNVKEVWLTGLHGEPFAPLNSKQPDAYAFQSGVIADRVADNPPPGLPFIVRHAAYIYAETTPRADGLFWELSDFSGDKLHLSNQGNKKAAGLLEVYALNALSGEPPPDPNPNPDPDPGPTTCEPIPPQTQCRLEDNDAICHCRFPDTFVLIADVPDPDPQQCNDVPKWASFCEWVPSKNRCACRK